ncbi:MAG: methyltransferase [Thermodesulfobacteriota bacterium]
MTGRASPVVRSGPDKSRRNIIKKNKTELNCYGLLVYKSRHPFIRRIKRGHAPSDFGYRVWPSSWLLMDFIRQDGLPPTRRVMDVGCGWGLAGIYCAKNHQALVTSVDIDEEVFPFLILHSEANNVQVTTVNSSFDQLADLQLRGIDLLIGADICFHDEMVKPLIAFFDRALALGVGKIILADPGRSSFETLANHYVAHSRARTWSRTVMVPHLIFGRILKVSAVMA